MNGKKEKMAKWWKVIPRYFSGVYRDFFLKNNKFSGKKITNVLFSFFKEIF